MTDREKILKGALEKSTQIKDLEYGKPEDNFNDIAEFWNTYLAIKRRRGNHMLRGDDVANMMVLLKMVRIMNGTEVEDSYIDGCGYFAGGYECRVNQDKTRKAYSDEEFLDLLRKVTRRNIASPSLSGAANEK